jgi:hypothetical protein
VTKNILAVLVDQQRSVDWPNQYLILPLESPRAVRPGDFIRVRFSYQAGATLEALAESLHVDACQGSAGLRRAA